MNLLQDRYQQIPRYKNESIYSSHAVVSSTCSNVQDTTQISPNVSITNLSIVSYNVRLLLVIYLLQQMVPFYSANHLGEC